MRIVMPKKRKWVNPDAIAAVENLKWLRDGIRETRKEYIEESTERQLSFAKQMRKMNADFSQQMRKLDNKIAHYELEARSGTQRDSAVDVAKAKLKEFRNDRRTSKNLHREVNTKMKSEFSKEIAELKIYNLSQIKWHEHAIEEQHNYLTSLTTKDSQYH